MIISSVRILNQEILKELSKSYSVIVVNTNMTLPIKIAYETPETLGIDRICGAIGAQFLFPNQPTLSIDAGTCITYDFVDQNGIYHGGAISPGIQMRLDAMHKFTGKLPQTKFLGHTCNYWYNNCIFHAIRELAKLLYSKLKDLFVIFSQAHQGLKVILTGGNTGYFEQQIENTIFAAQNLVLIGLDRIVAYTMKNE